MGKRTLRLASNFWGRCLKHPYDVVIKFLRYFGTIVTKSGILYKTLS